MGLLAAQEADDRCYRSRLIKTPDRISEGPPRGGLSFCARKSRKDGTIGKRVADDVAVHESVIGT